MGNRGRKDMPVFHGEEHPMHKLSERDVKAIYQHLKEGVLSGMQIAALFPSISRSTVYHLLYGDTWNHLDLPPLQRRGLICKGENKPFAKLRDADIPVIRQMIKAKVRQVDIAETFGVSRTVIRAIRDGKAWIHIPDKESS